ncbi:MAG: MFS transporter [Burkholderiaceae bacterium]
MLPLLSFAMFIVSLDQYIVVVALPDIGRDLGYSPQTLQAVISAYAISSSGFLLLGGRASDLLGRRRILMAGLLLYGLASLAGGLATSTVQQLAARAAQGLGGALVFPSTLALINVLFSEGAARNRALGIWAGAGAGGLVVGVLLGGALTSSFGWRAVFIVNVPLAGAALVASLALIVRDGPLDRSRPFDLPGAAAATASVTLIVLTLVRGPDVGWSSPSTLGALLVGIALACAFVALERRSPDPVLPLAMLANRWLSLAAVSAVLFMATFGTLLYFLSLFFQGVLGYDALEVGLAFLVPTVIVTGSSALAGRIATRFGLRNSMACALFVGAGGALMIGLAARVDASYLGLLPGMIVVSIGDGVMFTAIFIAAAKGVPSHQQGVASGIVSTASGVGAAVGLAVMVLIANRASVGLVGEELREARAAGIADAAFTIAAGIALNLLIVLAWRIRPDGAHR